MYNSRYVNYYVHKFNFLCSRNNFLYATLCELYILNRNSFIKVLFIDLKDVYKIVRNIILIYKIFFLIGSSAFNFFWCIYRKKSPIPLRKTTQFFVFSIFGTKWLKTIITKHKILQNLFKHSQCY